MRRNQVPARVPFLGDIVCAENSEKYLSLYRKYGGDQVARSPFDKDILGFTSGVVSCGGCRVFNHEFVTQEPRRL